VTYKSEKFTKYSIAASYLVTVSLVHFITFLLNLM